MSHKKVPSDKGITDHPIKLSIKDSAGESRKIRVLAVVGNVVSLVNNFKPSASGCNKPI